MIVHDGRRYGTAAEIGQALGVTADRVRDWGRRAADPTDTLHGRLDRHHLPGRGRGTTWYRLDQAVEVEHATRRRVELCGGPARTGAR